MRVAALPAGAPGGALHRAQARPDAHRLKVVADRLGQREERGKWSNLAGVEAVRIAGLGQELLGPGGVVGRRLEGPREFETPWDEPTRRVREAERLRLVEG